MSETALGKLFFPHGAVKQVNLITDHYTRQSKCFGYVEMSDKKEADAVISLLDGAMINSRPLIVRKACPRFQREGRAW